LSADIALALGAYTRFLALFFAAYALAAAFIGHRYWTMAGGEHVANLYGFFKNLSIAGGFLVLSAIRAGKYSVDRE
jgi:putative oxidoreductase